MAQPLILTLQNITTNESITHQAMLQPQNIQQVLQTLQSSLYILYLHYQPYLHIYQVYIKIVILILVMYLSHKLGTYTVFDNIRSQKEQLKSLIRKRNTVKDQLPRYIQKVQTNIKITILMILVLVAGLLYAYYTEYALLFKKFQLPLIISASTILLFFVYLNIKKLILTSRLNKVGKFDLAISKKLNQFTESLGPKVISILKYHLCKDIQTKLYAIKTVNQCRKQSCKQLRGLLKQRSDSIGMLAEQTLDFEWCSVCKKREPFDEYLPFESKPYHESENGNEQDEVKNKLGYLVEGMQRMRRWIGQTSPCNCSKLYWKRLTTHIIEYKKSQKMTQAAIAINKVQSRDSF